MPRKTLASVLHEVDPKLKVVSGSKNSRKARATVAEFQSMAGSDGGPSSDAINHCQLKQADFERAAGIACPSCGQETLRLLPLGKTRGCLACSRKAIERSEQEIEMKALLHSLRGSRRGNRR